MEKLLTKEEEREEGERTEEANHAKWQPHCTDGVEQEWEVKGRKEVTSSEGGNRNNLGLRSLKLFPVNEAVLFVLLSHFKWDTFQSLVSRKRRLE